MEFYDAIKARRSIRKFKPDAVPQEALDRILEAARIAPSWKNMQCWQFVLIDDAAVKQQLAEATQGNPCSPALAQAPYVLVVCGDPQQSGDEDGKQYYLADCGIVFEHIVLAAAAEGLGTTFLGLFDEAKIKGILGIPDEIRVVGFTPLGVPDQQPKDRGRKPLEELLHKNKWGGR